MPAMKVTTSPTETELIVQIAGDLDEESQFEPIDFAKFDEITIDTSEIGMINSCGIRTWLGWVSKFPPNKRYVFTNCPKIFIDSANMIRDFIPAHALIKSIEIPYFCEACSNVTSLYLINDGSALPTLTETETCKTCGQLAELDIFPETYLRILRKRSST